MLGAVAAVVAGVLYPLAFPPAGVWPLAFVALVPLFVAIRTARTDLQAGVFAVLWTFACAAMLAGWLPDTLASYYGRPWAVAVLGAAAVTLVTGGAEYVGFGLCVRRLGWVYGAVRPAVVAAAWVAAELARGKLLSGNPWGFVGYTQTPQPALLQLAGVAGVYGIGFVVAIVNAAVAELAIATWRGPARARWGALGGVVVAGVIVAGAWTWGASRLATATPPSTTTPVLVVQTDVEVSTQWNREVAARNLRRYLALTSEGLAAAPAAVAFWPENAITFDVDRDPLAVTLIGDTLGSGQTQLVTGAPRSRPDGGPPYDSALLFSPNGRLRAWQDKRYLIPFVEYFPYGGEALLTRDDGEATTLTPGRLGAALPTAAGAAGVMLCDEGLFPEAAADLVGAGAHYLVNLANDSWQGATFALQAFEVARLRAVEQGRYVVRVSTTGPSGVIDPWGRTVATTPSSGAATAVGAVASRRERTLYGRYGDWFAYLCLLLAGVCGMAGWAQ